MKVTCNIKQFLELVPYILKNKTYGGRPIPVMIIGKHGIGKSEIIAQLGKELDMPVENVRAGELTEGDFSGIPQAIEGEYGGLVTTFAAPDMIHQACNVPTIFFLDEINRGTPEVQQGMFKLADSGKVVNHEFHKDTMLISAMNPSGGDYQVHEMDPAALDRWYVINLVPTEEEWLSWAQKNNINPIVVSYIEDHPKSLDPPDSFEVGKTYPSRRSWTRMGKTLTAMEAGIGADGISQSTLQLIASGYVGEAHVVPFAKYYKSHAKDNAFKRYLEKGKFDGDIKLEDAIDALEILSQRKIFNKTLDNKMAKNVIKFATLIPRESLQTLAWEHIQRGTVPTTEKLLAMPVNDGSGMTFGQFIHKNTIDND